MKEIPLSQNKVAMVDDDMFIYLIQWVWHARFSGTNLYAERNDNETGKTVRMHHVIMNITDPVEVDHMDRNGLHNWRDNLRVCTTSQNQANRDRPSNNTSGYKGVSWHKHAGKYRAYITTQGKVYTLGYYADPKEAARAYNTKAHELFGKFARLNIIT